MMPIPYSCQNISDDDISSVVEVLKSDFLTQGPAVTAFEDAFARRHKVKHAIAVSSGTAALHIACLGLGVGPGSRVWTSPNSFLASANCALYCGASVDFVDIDPMTRNMSAKALEEKLIKAKSADTLPDAVIPVDFAGLPCDLREIRKLSDVYGFKIIEDASHATGSEYLGQPVGGAFSHLAVFSFHAVKIVTTAEGGMITTQDDAIAQRLRSLRSHGMIRDPRGLERESEGGWYYEQQALGFNYRMTDVQAALGRSQLRRMEEMRNRRELLADRYDELLAPLPVILPPRRSDRRSAWHLYIIEIDNERTRISRRQVYDALTNAGIGANVHYIPIHTQPFYTRLGFKRGDFPESERYYERAISIPLFPELRDEQQTFIAQVLAAELR